MKTNPLFLAGKKLHSAVNLAFEEGTVRTRPGIIYGPVVASGCFQGIGEYRPARGISSRAFGESGCSLLVVVDGTIYRDGCPTGPAVFACTGPVFIYQAESYLIFQSPQSKTYWWNGTELVASPGMNESDWNDPTPQRTVIESETPVASIPACENITGDEDYLVMFTIFDEEDNDPLPGVHIVVYHNNHIFAQGTTDGYGKWTFRSKKRAYNYTGDLACYRDIAGKFTVRGNTEVVNAMEPSCENCSWDILSATTSTNGSSTTLGTLIIGNTGEADLTITDVGVVCGGSVIDPPLPIVVPPDGNISITVSSLECELTDTTLTVTTDCGSLTGVWEEPGTGACGFSISNEHADTEDPEPAPEDLYYWVVFDITNTGTELIELTEMVFDGMSTLDPLFMSSPFPISVNIGETRTVSFPWVFDGSGYEMRDKSVLLITSCDSTSIFLPNDPPMP